MAPGVLEGATLVSQAGGPGSAGVNLRSFGTNAWEITSGNKTIWMDPWLTRYDSGAFSGRFDGSTPISVDTGVLDTYITNVDIILLGHGHFDHIADVPYVAKKTGAMVIGSETHNNLLRGFGVPDKQLVQVSGGENMQFDGFSIEVFRGLHGLDGNKQYVFPHTLNTVPAAPTRTDQLYEGGTFVYQLTRDDGFAILLMSTGNFVERELSGLHPDVAILGATSTYTQTHQYNARLLKALNYPAVILPTHWDNWEKPLTEPAVGNVDPWVAEVKQLSPNSKVFVLDHLQSYAA
ncbi:MAG: MBL fold metallo-hydrolase [Chloroflexi bacterium]|nr:MBL fold metallo-hydrolase [Chloroflexota bacterium]MBV9597167.1 MBL fold metallo-hydrolase [Chloroflexota bacterium]